MSVIPVGLRSKPSSILVKPALSRVLRFLRHMSVERKNAWNGL